MDWLGISAAIVFAATFLLLALGRVGRIAIPRGIAALVGGVATKFLLGVPWSAIDFQVILLIVGLMALAGLSEEAGMFAGLRRRLAHRTPAVALWICCALVALTSAVLLNDAAVVILVPFLLPTLLARGLPPVPSVTLLAVAANVGSLLTPFGNPQNAVLAHAANLSVQSFLVRQGPLVIVGLLLLAVASFVAARRANTVAGEQPAPAQAKGRPWLLLCLGLFISGAVIGQVALGTLAAATVALAYIGLRPIMGPSATRGVRRGLDANVIALFIGLYLITGGLQSWFPADSFSPSSLQTPGLAAVVVTAFSNIVGNVPAVLSLLRLDPAWTIRHAHFLVTVSTLGGALFLTGSAASLLAADQARRFGVQVNFLPFLRSAALWVLPILVLGAWWNW